MYLESEYRELISAPKRTKGFMFSTGALRSLVFIPSVGKNLLRGKG